MGVWIETYNPRENHNTVYVTPYVGVWIETDHTHIFDQLILVTPYVGVWIETRLKHLAEQDYTKSHPTWVCGLKPNSQHLVGEAVGHTLRGCVD